MYKKELKLIVWLIAGSLFCYSDSTLPADDLYLRSEKVESTGRGNEARSRDQKVPEFMVKMYKSVETGNNQLPVGNTVRSMAGKFMRLSDGSVLIVYNVSALAASGDERILRADIRYSRQQSSPNISPAVENETMTSAILLELTSRRFRQLGKHLLMTSPSPGWVSVDVTSSLRRLRRRSRRSSSRRRSSLLALTFDGSGQSGEGGGQGQLTTRRRRTAADLRLLSSPTLVVFSRRTADIAVDHVLPHVSEYRPPRSTWRSSAHRHRRKQKTKQHQKSKRSVDREEGSIVDWYPGIDNLLPLDDGNSARLGSYNIPPVLTDTARLDPQQQQQQQHRRRQRQDAKTVATTAVNSLAKLSVSPGGAYDDNVVLDNSSGDETQQRKTKKQLPPESSVFLDFAKTAEHDARRQLLVCSRRRLIVDAVDIGWNEHVIFPRQFQADYCAGSCPFPQSKVQSAVMKLCAQDVKQSNHATIQSLVHLIGIVADVPAPCCVADRMWSLPVLYVDHDDSVVLTVYEDAVVRSCICR